MDMSWIRSFHIYIISGILCISWLRVAGDRCSSLQPSEGRAWLETKRPLTVGVVKAVSLTLCDDRPVVIQLWIEDGQSWALVWQREVSVNSGFGDPTVINLPSAAYVDALPTYRLGVWAKDGGSIPVPAMFDASMPQSVTSDDTGPFTVQNTYTFSDVKRPYTFDVDFCTETDCPSVDPHIPAARTPEPSPTPTDTVDCDAVGGGVSSPHTSGRVIADMQRPLPTGTLLALSFRACQDTEFSVQIWRPQSDGADYTLVWMKKIHGFTRTGGEKTLISLRSEETLLLANGDRVGLHTAGDSLPIPFTFNAAGKVSNSASPGPGDLCSPLAFDSIKYPYQFHLELCNVTGCGLLGVSYGGDTAEVCPDNSTKQETNGDSGDPSNGGSKEQTANKSSTPRPHSVFIAYQAILLLTGLSALAKTI